MPKRRLIRSILTIAAVGVILGVFAGPTVGGETARSSGVDRPFDFYTGTTKTPGRAHVYGKVRFLSGGGVRVEGYINDNCPADGYFSRVTFGDGGGGLIGAAADRRGCEESTAKFYRYTYRRTDGRRVLSVFIDLQERKGTKSAFIVGDTNTLLRRR